jgi:tetratricopeptide (TPR) repeat protein
LNMGNYYDRKGEVDKVIELLEKAVAARKDFPDAWFNLGNAYLRIKNCEKAISSYERALRYQPEFSSALKNLGFAYEQNENLEKAEEQYQKALALNKADATIYVNLGTLYAKQRRYDKAKDYYLRAVKLSPKDLTGWMGLRHLSLIKGDIPTYVRATLAVLHRLDAGAVTDAMRRLRELGYHEGVDSIIKLADKLAMTGDDLDGERLLAYSRVSRNDGRGRALHRRLNSLPQKSDALRLCLAEYEYRTHAYDKTLEQLDNVTSHELSYHLLLWKAMIGMHQQDKVCGLIETYLDEHDDCFEGWFLLARAKLATKGRDEARESLVRALQNGFADFDAIGEDAGLKALYDELSADK